MLFGSPLLYSVQLGTSYFAAVQLLNGAHGIDNIVLLLRGSGTKIIGDSMQELRDDKGGLWDGSGLQET